jgi:hypothetical protein
MGIYPIKPSKIPAPGWVGGFSTSKREFAYPHPDLTSLPILDNMANINLLDRQLDVLWPEFSWQTEIGNEDSRCYSMFAPDISRAGYTKEGRIYSIICPQQGSWSPTFGDLNIEVTVTGNRGWVNESTKTLDVDLVAADMNVVGKIWFGPSAKLRPWYNLLKLIFAIEGLAFPLDKANAIQVDLHAVGDPNTPTINVRSGIHGGFCNPPFALHHDCAWAVANVAVQIGGIAPRGSTIVDDFNALVMAFFNLASGNLLKETNILTWNVWLNAPTIVDRAEWKAHAEVWRQSIDTGHGSPDGEGTSPRYFNGDPFEPFGNVQQQEEAMLKAFMQKHESVVMKHVDWLKDVAA